MTLAPELPGALELDRRCCTRAASWSRAATPTRPPKRRPSAFDRGVATVTHLFNAMRPLRHRDPGIVGAALGPRRRRRAAHPGRPPSRRGDRAGGLARGGGPRRARHRRDRGGRRRRRGLPARRHGRRGARRRRAPRRRRPGRQRRSRCSRPSGNLHALGVAARGRGRRRPPRSRRGSAGSPRSACSGPAAAADVVVLDDRLELRAVLVGGRGARRGMRTRRG